MIKDEKTIDPEVAKVRKSARFIFQISNVEGSFFHQLPHELTELIGIQSANIDPKEGVQTFNKNFCRPK